MLRLNRLYEAFDGLELPSCCKTLAIALAKAREKGTTLKLSRDAFLNGSDSGPMQRHGFIRRRKNNAVEFTQKAEELLQ